MFLFREAAGSSSVSADTTLFYLNLNHEDLQQPVVATPSNIIESSPSMMQPKQVEPSSDDCTTGTTEIELELGGQCTPPPQNDSIIETSSSPEDDGDDDLASGLDDPRYNMILKLLEDNQTTTSETTGGESIASDTEENVDDEIISNNQSVFYQML